ncbi:MAG: ABC transporter ATP-binding protein [Eubacteriaceae bacterium]|nr:ABC transporter ATP-binding protein [Eubacteriaceae bacterium]
MAVLSIEKATFSYNGTDEIFTDLSYTMESNEVFCILGPNGIGKTTLLKSLMNLHPLKSGVIKIDGNDLRNIGQRQLAKLMSFIPQTTQFTFPYKVLDVVLMGRTPHLNAMSQPSREDYQKSMEAIELLGIKDLIFRPVTQLSGGQLQLVMLARAIAQEAKFLLLDEPTNHLDYGKQMQTLSIIKAMKERNVGMIMTSHNPDHAFLACDKVAIMNRGQFTSVGTPDEVVTKKNLKEIYGIDVDIIEYEGSLKRKVCIPLLEGHFS